MRHFLRLDRDVRQSLRMGLTMCPDHHVSRHPFFHEDGQRRRDTASQDDRSKYIQPKQKQTQEHPVPPQTPLVPSLFSLFLAPLPSHTPYSSSPTTIPPSGVSNSTSSSPQATHANSTTSLTGPPDPMKAPTAPDPPPRSCARRLRVSSPTCPSSPTHREAWGSFGSSKSWAKETV